MSCKDKYQMCQYFLYAKDLKKQGDLRHSLALLGVTPLWHVAQWGSRAPTPHTLPAFLNLDGSIKMRKNIAYII